METGTAIAAPWPTDLKVVFGKEDGAAAIIARVRSEAIEKAKGLTVATKKDRDAIASVAYDVAKRKTALDNAGKALNDDLRVSINAVDAERRQIRESLDALKDEVRAPLTKWEADEAARVDALKARVGRVERAQDMLPENPTAEQIGALLARVSDIAIDATWAEFALEAARAKDAACATLRQWHVAAVQREADAAELERLRAEADAREEADRLRVEAERAEAERIAAEKAESDRLAKIEADAADRATKAAQEAEALVRLEAEQQRLAAEQAAQREAQEAADREAALERQLVDAERKSEADKAEVEARHAKDMADTKAQVDRAAQAERDRIAAQATAEAVARAKREADTDHRARIKANIVAALSAMRGNATPDAIADALMAGTIPHCKVGM